MVPDQRIVTRVAMPANITAPTRLNIVEFGNPFFLKLDISMDQVEIK